MSCFLAAIFSVLGVAKNADDVANAKTKLTMAETAHQTAEEEFRKAVGEHFDELEKKASNRGDRKSLGQIAAQREAFKSNRDVPLSLPFAPKKKYSQQRAILDAAYETTLRTLIKAKDKDAVADVEKRMKEFRQSSFRRLTAAQGRPITKGTVLKGTFRSWRPTKKGEASVARSDWKFTVLTANETSFTGAWEWDGGVSIVAVSGRLGSAGFIFLKFVRNIKGNDVAVQGGSFEGVVTDDGKLTAKYTRLSENRVGEILGEIIQAD
jgi:hypothetical protein